MKSSWARALTQALTRNSTRRHINFIFTAAQLLLFILPNSSEEACDETMLNVLRSRALKLTATDSCAFCRHIHTHTRSTIRYPHNFSSSLAKKATRHTSSAISKPRLTSAYLYGHLAGQQKQPEGGKPQPQPQPATEITPKKTPTPLDSVDGGKELSKKEQRRKDWAIVKRLLPHIWPQGDWGVRSRVIFGFALLLAGKVRIAQNHSQDVYADS